jgi:rare lipoprotein A (peptidoglycan hydrolase)
MLKLRKRSLRAQYLGSLIFVGACMALLALTFQLRGWQPGLIHQINWQALWPAEKFNWPSWQKKSAPTGPTRLVVASWYGPGFHGNTMANGQVFDQDDRTTVAHKALPFGSRVLLRDDDGRKLVVVVRDDGPHRAGRELDLSAAGADYFGARVQGLVRLQATVLCFGPKLRVRDKKVIPLPESTRGALPCED